MNTQARRIVKASLVTASAAAIFISLVIAGTPGSPGDTTADVLVGQHDFTHNMINFGGAQALNAPSDVAVDPAGHIYVSDAANNRVLGWHSAASFTNGAAADLVIGQPDFFSSACNDGTGAGDVNGLGADSLCFGGARGGSNGSVAADAAGNLYIADTHNNRVLEYNTPFAGFSGTPIVGPAASLVFGQNGSFTTKSCNGGTASGDVNGIGPDSLCSPFGLAADGAGNVYVGDEGGLGVGRILEYDNPVGSKGACTPLANGSGCPGDTIADRVFGHDGSFTDEACNDGTNSGDVPVGGGNAQGTGLGPDSLCSASGIAIGPNGNVFIADEENDRVLEYFNPLGSANGCTPNADGSGCAGDTNADRVFGQPNFVTIGCTNAGPSGTFWSDGPNHLCVPDSVAVDGGGNLYVADRNSGRVLGYLDPDGSSAGCTPNGDGSGCPGDTVADLVFGQNNSFTENTDANGFAELCDVGTGMSDVRGIGLDSLCTAYSGVAADGAGDLFIADTLNNRVLEYNTPTTSGTNANRELGQLDLFHDMINFGGGFAQNPIQQQTFGSMSGIAIDKDGHVYVSDTVNNRVLGWHSVAALTSGAGADLVLGQSDFNSAFCDDQAPGSPSGFIPTASATTLCGPHGLATDSGDNLYVVDNTNDRVLEFNAPFASFTGSPIIQPAAHLVFGQNNSFTTPFLNCNGGSPTSPTAKTLCFPTGAAVDGQNNLWVSDSSNSRVLEFDQPLGSGAGCTPNPDGTGCPGDTTADAVVGAGGSFTTRGFQGTEPGDSQGTGPDTVGFPSGLAFDASNNLYVADWEHARVLEYNQPLGSSGGCTPAANGTGCPGDTIADHVFGQNGSFTGNACNDTVVVVSGKPGYAGSLCAPTGVAVDGLGNVYIADDAGFLGGQADRIFQYDDPLGANGNCTPDAYGVGCPGDFVADRVFGQSGSGDDFLPGGCVLGANGLCEPEGLALDSAGDLFAIDSHNNRLLEYLNPVASPAASGSATSTSTATATATATSTATATHTATPTATATATPGPSGGATPVPATLKFAPKVLHFGTEIELGGVGATSAPRTVMLFNLANKKQDVTITITGISITGDFAKSVGATTCGNTIAPGVHCNIGVTFTPTAAGQRTGTLTITTNAGGSPTITVPLGGKGLQGKLTFTPKSINFGKESVGSQTDPKTVTVANKNPVPMSFSAAVSGPFVMTSNNCPASIAANGSCSIGVAFKPTTAGKLQGALSFTDTAVGNPQSVKLLGTGSGS